MLFRAETGEALGTLFTLDVDEASITALAFCPDGRELASGCEDGSARVYSVKD